MDLTAFIHESDWGDFPDAVRHQARRCLLDTLGAGIGGRRTKLSQIIFDFAASIFGGQGAHLWLDGREVSPPGASLANGMTIDALDIHDGHPLVKGHAGAAIVPSVFATLSLNPSGKISGKELLTTLVIGYEIALRAGIALHATACDYHTSGAWNALGAAAVTARRLGLDSEQTLHALGIAEYHGPRSQMMRCIDDPTMVKDGSGWGAMAGVSAAMMAKDRFTGAPAITVVAEEVKEIWENLGRSWRITEQYFKPHAVCRWAQPALEAAVALQKNYRIKPENIRSIKAYTFHEAVRLSRRRPENTEEAQYSLPFPVAAALVYGRLGSKEVSGNSLTDSLVLKLCDCIEVVEDKTCSARFPAKRFARVEIETTDGDGYSSGDVEANWEADRPPSDIALLEKFRWLVNDQLPEDRAGELEQMVWSCEQLPDAAGLLALIVPPPKSAVYIT